MGKLPGAPAGAYFTPKELKQKVTNYNLKPGQRVKLNPLPKDARPTRIEVVKEYNYHIVLKFSTKHASWNYSVNKNDLVCGDAKLYDEKGHNIQPQQDTNRKERRQRRWANAS